MSDQTSTANPPQTESKPYTRPKLYVGMPVKTAFDMSFSRPMLGIVNIVKTQSAAILVYGDRGPMIYPDCRHIGDPWLTEHPAWIGGHGHAVFDLNEAETERIATQETLQRLLPLVEQQSRKIAQLEAAIENQNMKQGVKSESDAPPVKRRGRPRRAEPTQESQ